MKPGTAMLWKEWRELKWDFAALLGMFLILPFGEALQNYARYGRAFYSDMFEGLVLGFGGLVAVIMAIGVTHQDLKPGVQTFWQSRPISLTRWVLTSYVAGLTVVLVATCLPLLIQMLLYRFRQYGDLNPLMIWEAARTYSPFTMSVLFCHTFTIVLIYSVAFLLGCMVRRAVHAAILGIAAGLALYFLPLVLPPLGWLSVFNVMEQTHWQFTTESRSGYAAFVAAMVAASACAGVLAWWAVRRDWRLQLNLATMCWTLGAIVLIIAAAAAFQVGTNLTCERMDPVRPQHAVFAHHAVLDAQLDPDGQGLLLLNSADEGYRNARLSFCRFAMKDGAFSFGRELPVGTALYVDRRPPMLHVAWPSTHRDRAYLLTDAYVQKGYSLVLSSLDLWTVALDAKDGDPVLNKLELLDRIPNLRDESHVLTAMTRHGNQLYIPCFVARESRYKALVVDLSNPDAPAVSGVVDAGECGFGRDGYRVGAPAANEVLLLDLPELSERERLELSLALEGGNPVGLDGDLLVVVTKRDLTTFRVTGFEGNVAKLERLGVRESTPLERLVETHPYGVMVRNGLAYVFDYFIEPSLTVYDLREPERPRRVGHYTAPNERFHAIVPLPDGRMLIGGQQLHTLLPPKLD